MKTIFTIKRGKVVESRQINVGPPPLIRFNLDHTVRLKPGVRIPLTKMRERGVVRTVHYAAGAYDIQFDSGRTIRKIDDSKVEQVLAKAGKRAPLAKPYRFKGAHFVLLPAPEPYPKKQEFKVDAAVMVKIQFRKIQVESIWCRVMQTSSKEKVMLLVSDSVWLTKLHKLKNGELLTVARSYIHDYRPNVTWLEGKFYESKNNHE